MQYNKFQLFKSIGLKYVPIIAIIFITINEIDRKCDITDEYVLKLNYCQWWMIISYMNNKKWENKLV